MKIYAMSDIHGHLQEFEAALELVDLSGNNILILLGDYVHSGPDGYGVIEKIMKLQNKYGTEKVVALMGNHEELVIEGRAPVQEMWKGYTTPEIQMTTIMQYICKVCLFITLKETLSLFIQESTRKQVKIGSGNQQIGTIWRNFPQKQDILRAA